jgi:hypothetical protein
LKPDQIAATSGKRQKRRPARVDSQLFFFPSHVRDFVKRHLETSYIPSAKYLLSQLDEGDKVTIINGDLHLTVVVTCLGRVSEVNIKKKRTLYLAETQVTAK